MPSPASPFDLTARSTAAFRAVAGEGTLLALDDDAAVVYGVAPDLSLHFFNQSWRSFALANEGGRCLDTYGIGSSVRKAIPPVLVRFYEKAFDQSVARGRPWEHVYECSSPTELRSFRMRVHPLGNGFLVVTNDLVRTTDAPTPTTARLSDYVGDDGVLVQCAHCRRCRRHGTETWDWVPTYVATPFPGVSHGFCRSCLHCHYGE